MKQVRITRVATNATEGTFGVLTVDGMPFCVTLEPYSNDNQSNVSCIPAQQYMCKPYSSAKYNNVYQVMNVPGRSSILFHSGNTDNHTEGCIILASYYGKLNGDWAALNSGTTFNKFREYIAQDDFLLTIKESY